VGVGLRRLGTWPLRRLELLLAGRTWRTHRNRIVGTHCSKTWEFALRSLLARLSPRLLSPLRPRRSRLPIAPWALWRKRLNRRRSNGFRRLRSNARRHPPPSDLHRGPLLLRPKRLPLLSVQVGRPSPAPSGLKFLQSPSRNRNPSQRLRHPRRRPAWIRRRNGQRVRRALRMNRPNGKLFPAIRAHPATLGLAIVGPAILDPASRNDGLRGPPVRGTRSTICSPKRKGIWMSSDCPKDAKSGGPTRPRLWRVARISTTWTDLSSISTLKGTLSRCLTTSRPSRGRYAVHGRKWTSAVPVRKPTNPGKIARAAVGAVVGEVAASGANGEPKPRLLLVNRELVSPQLESLQLVILGLALRENPKGAMWGPRAPVPLARWDASRTTTR
jgi:hypothetical protein